MGPQSRSFVPESPVPDLRSRGLRVRFREKASTETGPQVVPCRGSWRLRGVHTTVAAAAEAVRLPPPGPSRASPAAAPPSSKQASLWPAPSTPTRSTGRNPRHPRRSRRSRRPRGGAEEAGESGRVQWTPATRPAGKGRRGRGSEVPPPRPFTFSLASSAPDGSEVGPARGSALRRTSPAAPRRPTPATTRRGRRPRPRPRGADAHSRWEPRAPRRPPDSRHSQCRLSGASSCGPPPGFDPTHDPRRERSGARAADAEGRALETPGHDPGQAPPWALDAPKGLEAHAASTAVASFSRR